MQPLGPTLLALQGRIKRDPEGYAEDFDVQLRKYQASLNIFALRPTQQAVPAKDFGELVTFLAQVSNCFPQRLSSLPAELMHLLDCNFTILSSGLRLTIIRALILLRKRGQLPVMTLFSFLVKMFRCPDKGLRLLAFQHIISDVKGANQQHHQAQLNRSLQNLLFGAVADTHEIAARKALAVLVELWRRHTWRDARTVSVITSALFHSSMRVGLPALKFFLGQDDVPEAEGDSGDEGEGGGPAGGDAVPAPSRAEVYKATQKGTAASKKKKKAKLQRVMATVKRAARKGRADNAQSFAAIQLLHDPQGLAEKLLERLQCSGGLLWEAKLAILQVVSRVVGVHRLLLLNLYPLLQKYLQPHQRDVPALLAVLIQDSAIPFDQILAAPCQAAEGTEGSFRLNLACHDLVPPETLQPVLRQLVDNFVHDRARPEVMTLGLRTVRELCARTPLVMTPELLQDLVLYRKFREKEVASAARSLVSLFRELAPHVLDKRDRGRGADVSVVAPEYGAFRAVDRIPGASLLQAEMATRIKADNVEGGMAVAADSDAAHSPSLVSSAQSDEDEPAPTSASGEANSIGSLSDCGSISPTTESEEADVASEGDLHSTEESEPSVQHNLTGAHLPDCIATEGSDPGRLHHDASKSERTHPHNQGDSISALRRQLADSREGKRQKLMQASLHGAGSTSSSQQHLPELDSVDVVPLEHQRILSAADFERIRELRQQELVVAAMAKHGLKPAAKRARLLAQAEDQAEEALEALEQRGLQGETRVDPAALQGRHKARKDKAARLLSVLEGRKGNAYGAAASRKKRKTGGMSNKEKQKIKQLPAAARSLKSKQRMAQKHTQLSKSR